MVTDTKDSGSNRRHMALVRIRVRVVIRTLDNGFTIDETGEAKRDTQMGQSMKDSSLLGIDMERELLTLQMAIGTREVLLTDCPKVLV